MGYEIKMAEKSLFKTLVVLIFYLFVLFFHIYSFLCLPKNDVEIFNQVLNCLFYPMFKEYSFTEELLYVFNNVYFVLYFAMFYIYEYIHIHGIIATRYDKKRWVTHKYVVGILFIILISLVQYLLIAYLFNFKMTLDMKYYLYPVLFKMLIMSILYTLYNFFKTNKIAFFIILIISSFLLRYFNPVIAIIIFVASFIFNYVFFDLRGFKYNFMRLNS